MSTSSPTKAPVEFDALASAKQLLSREIEGLEALSESLGQQFVAAIDAIDALKGRLIISGMGKSGHIGKKIAATMASTGTPAYFVHPAEASHGDLGMIAPEDGMLLLSNSGETAELHDMIDYAKRFSILLIGMVRRPTSMLVGSADIALVLPEIPEGSITGAPTTSTTMMLAYGDALAIALLEKRGFTAQDFQTFHPGGKLGQRFIRVEDLMHPKEELPLVSAKTSMSDALLAMTQKGFGCLGVINQDGWLVGIVTDGDLRRNMSPELLQKDAGEVMTAGPVIVRPTTLASEALGVMNKRNITSLFVVEEEKPVGLIHIHDLLRAGIV